MWTKKTLKIDLSGWVKNCKETVEFEVNEEQKIKFFIKDCYKGPLFSKVSKIDIKYVDFL